MKKGLVLLSSLLLVGSMPVFAQDTAANSTNSIAVVNVQQVFQQSPRIAELNKKLQSQFKSRQDKLVAQQKDLQDELDKFKKDSPTMNQKDKDELQRKIVDDQTSLQKDAAAFQQDLSKEQGKIMKSVLSELNKIISDIAKKDNFFMVLDSQAVIFANDKSDITKDVSKEFDKK